MEGGETLPHPHTQLVVIPDFVKLDIPPVDFDREKESFQETDNFLIFSPLSSEWPDEVWIAPKSDSKLYSEISDSEITDLAKTLYRLIQIFDLRHGHEFPFNFYISPRKGWYLRIIPRLKKLGGFELGTGVFLIEAAEKTIAFIGDILSPDEEKIRGTGRSIKKQFSRKLVCASNNLSR